MQTSAHGTPAAVQAPAPIVLAEPTRARTDWACHGTAFRVRDADWNTELSLQLSHGYLATWFGYERRLDAQGRSWDRRITAVHDDFGDLVEVAS